MPLALLAHCWAGRPATGGSLPRPRPEPRARGPRGGGPARVRHAVRFAGPLLVEAIGEGELPATPAPEACAFRVPHRKRPTEHRSFPALLAHEDDPPGRTV